MAGRGWNKNPVLDLESCWSIFSRTDQNGMGFNLPSVSARYPDTASRDPVSVLFSFVGLSLCDSDKHVKLLTESIQYHLTSSLRPCLLDERAIWYQITNPSNNRIPNTLLPDPAGKWSWLGCLCLSVCLSAPLNHIGRSHQIPELLNCGLKSSFAFCKPVGYFHKIWYLDLCCENSYQFL